MLHDLFTIQVKGKTQCGLNTSTSKCINVGFLNCGALLWKFTIQSGALLLVAVLVDHFWQFRQDSCMAYSK